MSTGTTRRASNAASMRRPVQSNTGSSDASVRSTDETDRQPTLARSLPESLQTRVVFHFGQARQSQRRRCVANRALHIVVGFDRESPGRTVSRMPFA